MRGGTDLELILASSPSTPRMACGILASRTWKKGRSQRVSSSQSTRYCARGRQGGTNVVVIAWARTRRGWRGREVGELVREKTTKRKTRLGNIETYSEDSIHQNPRTLSCPEGRERRGGKRRREGSQLSSSTKEVEIETSSPR